MELKLLEPVSGVHRLAINGETFLRMADLAREFDNRYQVADIGSEICKQFRQAKSDTFFYVEMNPSRKRGYYMNENLLDQLVHYAALTKERIAAELAAAPVKLKSKPIGSRTAKTKPKRRHYTPAMEHDRFVYPVTMIKGQELGYFADAGELWVKIADVARILRPGTQIYCSIPTIARTAGIDIRAVRHPHRGTRPSYFVPLRIWTDICRLCHISPSAVASRSLRHQLGELQQLHGVEIVKQVELANPVVDTQPVDTSSEIEQLKAMNAKLLETMSNMMSLFAKQSDDPVKVAV